MQKFFITLCLFILTSCTNSYGMELFESLLTKTATFFYPTSTNQKLWIKTTNKQITNCDQNTIQLSTLLTVAHQSGLFKNKNNALPINITTEDLALFIAASATQAEKFFTSLSLDNLYTLATCAYILKSPMLYAYLLKKILPSDIDHHIAPIIFPMKRIKSLMIKEIPSETIHDTTEIPFIENHTLTTHCTHDEQFHIATIQGNLVNNEPFNQTIIRNVHTLAIMKKFNDYNILHHHPTKNIIALGTTQKIANIPTLVLYNIDTDASIELVNDESIALLTFSPDGNYLAATYNNTNNTSISLWGTTDTSRKLSLVGHTENIDTLAFNPQSTKIISGSPEIKNCILLWDIKNSYSTTQKTLLTKQHHHFKKFIFSKDGHTALATTNKKLSFFLSLSDHENYCLKILDTPLYALFNASYIPEKHTYINGKDNLVECYNPYTIITAHGQPTDYSLVKTNHDETRSAAYTKDKTLNLYRLSLQKKEIKNKKLKGHIDRIHSLEFNSDDLLLSASQLQTTIWDHKGNYLQTITPLCRTNASHLSRTGQYLFTTSLSRHNGYGSACTEITQLFTTAHANAYECIKKNLSTAQAIILNNIYKNNKRTTETPYVIKKQSLEALTINSFTDPNECKLIHQVLRIAYSD